MPGSSIARPVFVAESGKKDGNATSALAMGSIVTMCLMAARGAE